MEQKNNMNGQPGFQQFNERPAKKHSRFLAVMFGFIPGAGHMYLGKMNRGLTLMGLFGLSIMLVIVFTPAVVLLPLVWFYAFFDCLNISALTQERLEALPDELGIGSIDLNTLKLKFPRGAGGRILGWAMILMGCYMLYDQLAYRVIELLQRIFEDINLWWLHDIVNSIPQVVVSVIIILLGVRLIKGGRKRTDAVPRYRGGGEADNASIMELIRARADETPAETSGDSCEEKDAPDEKEAEETAPGPEKEEA